MAEHYGVVVGQAHVELLQLYLGHPLHVPAGFVHVQQSPHGGQHVAPAPHLQVDGDGVDDGQSCLRLLPQDAGEDLGVVEVAGEGPLLAGGAEGQDSGGQRTVVLAEGQDSGQWSQPKAGRTILCSGQSACWVVDGETVLEGGVVRGGSCKVVEVTCGGSATTGLTRLG